MCGSMADIQSATAEIRRGKTKKKTEEETTGQKYNGIIKMFKATTKRARYMDKK